MKIIIIVSNKLINQNKCTDMKESEEEKIINSKSIQLSASTTGFSQKVSVLLIPFCIFIFYLVCIEDKKPNTNMVFSVGYFIVASTGMTYLIVSLLKKMVQARLVGNKILFKRSFSKEEEEIKLVDILSSNTIAVVKTRYLKIVYRTKDEPKSIWIVKPGMFSLNSDIEILVEFARKHYRIHKKFE